MHVCLCSNGALRPHGHVSQWVHMLRHSSAHASYVAVCPLLLWLFAADRKVFFEIFRLAFAVRLGRSILVTTFNAPDRYLPLLCKEDFQLLAPVLRTQHRNWIILVVGCGANRN